MHEWKCASAWYYDYNWWKEWLPWYNFFFVILIKKYKKYLQSQNFRTFRTIAQNLGYFRTKLSICYILGHFTLGFWDTLGALLVMSFLAPWHHSNFFWQKTIKFDMNSILIKFEVNIFSGSLDFLVF